MRTSRSYNRRHWVTLQVLASCGLFMWTISQSSCELDGDSASPSDSVASSLEEMHDSVASSLEEMESAGEVTCDAVAWAKQAQEAYFARRQEGSTSTEVDPPPYDEHCIPVIDKSCQVVCDCKFVKLHQGKFVVGASKSVPWDEWPRVGPNQSTGLCDDGSGIFIDPVPSIWAFDLLCQDGECQTVETGNLGADDEALEKYIEYKSEIWEGWWQ